MYEFIKKYPNVCFDKINKTILEINETNYIYRVAKLKKDKDLKLEEDTLIKAKNYACLVYLATLKNADKARIEKVIINCSEASAIFLYLTTVECINRELLEQVLLKTNDDYYINKYYLHKSNSIKSNDSIVNNVKIKQKL